MSTTCTSYSFDDGNESPQEDFLPTNLRQYEEQEEPIYVPLREQGIIDR